MHTNLLRRVSLFLLCACSTPPSSPARDAGPFGDQPFDSPFGMQDGGSHEDASPPLEQPYGPVVLVPAFHATTTNDWSLERVAEVLRGEGHVVHLADIPAYGGTPERADALLDEIDDARLAYCARRRPEALPEACLQQTRAHLVGHSQGGLDARFAVSNLGYGAHTWSVSTLSSPHRGTPLGDVGLALIGDPRAARSFGALVIRGVRRLFDSLFDDALRLDGLGDGLYWLSETRYRNQLAGAEVISPDIEGVYYQSWAGVATRNGALPDDLEACDALELFPEGRAAELRGLQDNTVFTAVGVAFDDEHGPRDGHIPVRSAKYGDFVGCLPVDHLDLIGRPEAQHEENIARAGWDYEAFYRELSARLLRIERGELPLR